MRNPLRLVLATLFVLACWRLIAAQSPKPAAPAPVYSQLWGKAGERWDPKGPLKDFSDAGYRAGKAAIPVYPVKVNVRDCGAKGDGRADDTAAFVKALESCPAEGAVLVPAGTYQITDWVKIHKKQKIELRGESREKSILVFTRGLEEIHPTPAKTTTGLPTTNWSWSGGFIQFELCSDAGLSNLTFRFPDRPYPGHFKEHGSNGVNLWSCDNGWARNLTFHNCDSGIFVARSHYVTVQDISFTEYKGRRIKPRHEGGHHAVDFTMSDHCLGDRIDFTNCFFHELGIEHGAHHNVYSACRGVDIHMDHHQYDPYGNLWTEIDLGWGSSAWNNNAHGSTKDEAYWNVRAGRALPYPAENLNNVAVGLQTTQTSVMKPAGPWHETIAPAALQPPNIYYAQHALREKK